MTFVKKYFCLIFDIKQIPPIVFPIFVIIWVIVFPFWITKFIWKWAFGFWKCSQCGNSYGPGEEKYVHWYAQDCYAHLCEGCRVINKIESSN